MSDGVLIKHDFKFFIQRDDGRTEETEWIDNLFVKRGMSYLARLQSTDVVSAMNFMHLGSGTVAATLSDIALGSQSGSRSVMASRLVTGANSNILTEVATFAGFLSGVTSIQLSEIGIFNQASSGGDMRSRAVFAPIVLADTDFLQVTYRTTVGSI
jgi:hypothetical protein